MARGSWHTVHHGEQGMEVGVTQSIVVGAASWLTNTLADQEMGRKQDQKQGPGISLKKSYIQRTVSSNVVMCPKPASPAGDQVFKDINKHVGDISELNHNMKSSCCSDLSARRAFQQRGSLIFYTCWLNPFSHFQPSLDLETDAWPLKRGFSGSR